MKVAENKNEQVGFSTDSLGKWGSTPLHWGRAVIDRIRTMQRDETKEVSLFNEVVKGIRKEIVKFHVNTLRNTAHWSHGFESITRIFFKKILIPLSFFSFGNTIREHTAEGMALIAKNISFIAMQIFHTFLYISWAAAITGTILLYNRSPVALLTLSTGGMLSILIILTYHVAKGIIETKRRIDGFNAVDFCENSTKAAKRWLLRQICWCIY